MTGLPELVAHCIAWTRIQGASADQLACMRLQLPRLAQAQQLMECRGGPRCCRSSWGPAARPSPP
eukprot:12884153-Prorocentrum_lima.AAC.1